MKLPPYSIIIAVKDMAEFIGQTIQNVLQQTHQPAEIIVVDDGSSDNSSEIAASFDRVRVIVNGSNRGKPYSRNLAIREASTEFIQMIDADDLLAPNKVATQFPHLLNSEEIDVVFGNVCVFEDGLEPDSGPTRDYHDSSDDILKQIITKNTIALHSLLIRKNTFERYGWFDDYFKISQDRELYIRWLLKGAKWVYEPESLCYYRRHPKSDIASKLQLGAHYNAMALRKHYKELISFKNGAYSQTLANSLRMLARMANMRGLNFTEVDEILSEVHQTGINPHISQNRLYQILESLFGAHILERLLQPKFWLDRKFRIQI